MDELRLTKGRWLYPRRSKARRQGICPRSGWSRAPHEYGREFLEAVQDFGPLDAHSRQPQIHGPLSWRIYFPLEPPPDAERDVRSFDFGCVASRFIVASNFFNSAGPMPRFSS